MTSVDVIGPDRLLAAVAEVVADDPDPTLAIYVHTPFCSQKCHFCDWVVHVPVRRLRADRSARREHLDALLAQIRFYGPQLTRLGYRPDVMYWGGGTPTRLDVEELVEIHTALDDSFDLSTLRQWSVETTPNDLVEEKVAALQALGMSRMSVGVQSLDRDQLRTSGRGHTREQSLRGVEMLRRVGVDNFNVDLISSFPGEASASLGRTLDEILALDPPHVSVYPYRPTPDTVMAMQLTRRQTGAHDTAHMIEGYEHAMRSLTAAGYHEYCHGYWVRDASHEDQDGNYKYDLAGDKIGFGSGAESILGHHLLWNENTAYPDFVANPREFSFGRRFTTREPERMMSQLGGALMTREGVVFERLTRLTGVEFADLRRTAYVRRWLDLLIDCGAEFLETDRSLRIRPDTIHRAYITHLAQSTLAGSNPQRA